MTVNSRKQGARHAYSYALDSRFKTTARAVVSICHSYDTAFSHSNVSSSVWPEMSNRTHASFVFIATVCFSGCSVPCLARHLVRRSGCCRHAEAGMKRAGRLGRRCLSWPFGCSEQLCAGDLFASDLPAWGYRGAAPRASKHFTDSVPEVLQRKIWLRVKLNLILGVRTWLYHPRLSLVKCKCYRQKISSKQQWNWKLLGV